MKSYRTTSPLLLCVLGFLLLTLLPGVAAQSISPHQAAISMPGQIQVQTARNEHMSIAPNASSGLTLEQLEQMATTRYRARCVEVPNS